MGLDPGVDTFLTRNKIRNSSQLEGSGTILSSTEVGSQTGAELATTRTL
jgi:hypothetical protein